ncbi:hypothetical protein [Lutibacter sp.]|uniref:hypothetical protein n=1 Tax=Lutibacter sp. TaxID=1925666 RepID=UPI0025BC427C|nr:hypothetical protein [Lutibacter sp.]MCF6181354.1 hypothetical protein [Lutibacter sp.]
MKKVLVTILSFTILFQSFNFQLEDITKIPTLVNHIADHFENGDSFMDFISMHYGSQYEIHKTKHKEHQKLPLKQYLLDLHFQVYISVYTKNLVVNSFKEINLDKKVYAYTELSSNFLLTKIFQPPKHT